MGLYNFQARFVLTFLRFTFYVPMNRHMAHWITNWPSGSRKWAKCSAAMAAQIVAEGTCQVRLVKNTITVSRFVLLTPEWAKPKSMGMTIGRAVEVGRRLAA